MAGAKEPPFKMVWFEAITDWLATCPDLKVPESDPVESVSRSAMNQTVAMVLRATRSETNKALVSARWVERMTGVNRGSVLKALRVLEAYGWLWWTQRRQNKVKVYQITLSQVVTDSHHWGSGGDTSGDRSGDTFSPTPGTPGTPLEELAKGNQGFCSNCEQPESSHSRDCPYRPLESRCGCANPAPSVADDDNYGRCVHCTLRMPDSWEGWAA